MANTALSIQDAALIVDFMLNEGFVQDNIKQHGAMIRNQFHIHVYEVMIQFIKQYLMEPSRFWVRWDPSWKVKYPLDGGHSSTRL